jgi:DNA-binding MarR family transcriptional regulator
VLDVLERRGLVRRWPHPTSRRSVLVATTERGQAQCDDILRRLHAAEAEWLAPMPEDERQAFLQSLGKAKGLLSRAHVPNARGEGQP